MSHDTERSEIRRPIRTTGCRFDEADLARFRRGTHDRLHDRLGAFPCRIEERDGVSFAVWAPGAERVSVIGGFNDWNPDSHPLQPLADAGVWSGFVPGVDVGALYKFHIDSRHHGYSVDKADPFALRSETPPETASIVWRLDYDWQDAGWLESRGRHSSPEAPMSIYELHVGSWQRAEDGGFLGYRRLADELIPYLQRMGFTHVELMPVTEHPFYGSWGYQTTGYFAATARYGEPQELMALIDRLHQADIGVILDWVPSHFPGDEHGPVFFDGTHLFEPADPRLGYHPDWNSYIFDYARREVQSFLLSSALFWIERYHVDALRVDAVASMLYRNYSRPDGQWVPNRHGGPENLEAVSFLRHLNHTVHERFPDVRTIAEESTTWPMVSRPIHLGGLGFDMKWDMGWMHDTLDYMQQDPIHRKHHHEALTFRTLYAFSENFVLPLSHDEVVHGKRSLIGKMPGDHWQQFAHLRLLHGYMFGLPGKKLLFMGGELGQWREWDHDGVLDWDLLRYPLHVGLQTWIADLNRAHRERPALHERDFDPRGFRWVDCQDAEQSVVSWTRHAADEDRAVLVVCNFTPVPRHNYRVGVPEGGPWHEFLNSDAESYGGGGQGNLGEVDAVPIAYHDRPFSLVLTLPPLAALFLECRRTDPAPGAVSQ